MERYISLANTLSDVYMIGGNISDEKIFDTVDMMMNQSLSTSLIATKLASLYLKEDGLVVLTGAGIYSHHL